MTAAPRAGKDVRHSRGAGPSHRESLREYGRGICGGFLFSMPLLYTMEVWWIGLTVSPVRLLVGLVTAYALLCAYNAYAGLHHDTSLTEILIDSVEELGLGLVVSALVLVMLGRLEDGGPADVIGQVVLEALFVAIGVSVGTAQLMGGQGRDDSGGRGRHDSVRAEITLALCGALLIAANVAPTEEIMRLAATMQIAHLLSVMGMSLVLAGTLLYFSHFRGSARFAETSGVHAVARGMAITYATALVASAGLLWFFGRFNDTAAVVGAAQVVVLGLPATLGASAGRLLLR